MFVIAFLIRKFHGGVARLVGMSEYVFERFKGVDFRHEKVCITDNRVNYGPALWYALRAIKNYLRDKVTQDDAIIDIGCGKGKMLYFFSKFPFRKVGGLEYSQRLIDIAERNMQKLLTRGGGGQLSRSFREMQQYIRSTTNIIISTSTTLSQM